ncbi:MAG TPA: EAL domain-containing protein, partial [Polyangiaceae bacterium]
QSTSIVTTVISLAHSLDLKVIAEGVETPQQAQLLRLLKCDQVQGFLVARPLPADDVSKSFGAHFNMSEKTKP